MAKPESDPCEFNDLRLHFFREFFRENLIQDSALPIYRALSAKTRELPIQSWKN